MCRLLKLQYACSSNGKPHYMENVQGAYIPCNDRHGCFIEEALALKPGSDTTPPGSPIEREYTIVKIGGDCETCANKKATKIEEEDKFFVEMNSVVDRTERELNAMVMRCGEISTSNRRRKGLARIRFMFLMMAVKECSVGNILALPRSLIAFQMFLLQGTVPNTLYTALYILAVELAVGFRLWIKILLSARGITMSLNWLFLLFAESYWFV
ncbi:hypothetical protein FOXYSP1_02802 [Fusarium oxysporum f. sp. phaseoli]